MTLAIDCLCGAALGVGKLAPGTRFRCPKCGARLVAQDTSGLNEILDLSGVANPDAIDLVDPDAAPSAAEPVAEQEAAGVPCPKCGAVCSEGDRLCVGCGTLLATGERVQAPAPEKKAPPSLPRMRTPGPLPTRAVRTPGPRPVGPRPLAGPRRPLAPPSGIRGPGGAGRPATGPARPGTARPGPLRPPGDARRPGTRP